MSSHRQHTTFTNHLTATDSCCSAVKLPNTLHIENELFSLRRTESLTKTIDEAWLDHPRLFLLHSYLGLVDCESPIYHPLDADELMQRFRDALQLRIQKRARAMMTQGRCLARTRVHTFWITDLAPDAVAGFQVVIVVNHDTFYRLDPPFPKEPGLVALIQASWQSVVGRSPQKGVGTVEYAPGCERTILGYRDDEAYVDAIKHFSQLCQVESDSALDRQPVSGWGRA